MELVSVWLTPDQPLGKFFVDIQNFWRHYYTGSTLPLLLPEFPNGKLQHPS
ncbi:hypothetical protein OUO20_05530 [Arthrobacter sp. FX8]|uniref:hypothetical protein n=1 Tax=Arthrobacter sp. FX8 TaxID=2997335 RepID=UPI00227D4BA1|nr:hypothetical protein [Arthrobacter sp. FX8]WAJ34396.1 hypothetical protein OUO20_05530 [Arthrobacter sp. FX8]